MNKFGDKDLSKAMIKFLFGHYSFAFGNYKQLGLIQLIILL